MMYTWNMTRTTVPLITGETYHIFNRGVDKRNIFSDKVDYYRFYNCLVLFNAVHQVGSIFELRWKSDWITNQSPLVEVNAYCLLNNHYHLLLTQVVDGGISEFMKRLGGGYTSYFNERNKRSGSLFQGKYKRVLCESNEQLLYLASYVNLNNIVHSRNEYFMSSYDTYTGKSNESFVKTDIILDQYKSIAQFIKDAVGITQQIADKRKSDKIWIDKTLLE